MIKCYLHLIDIGNGATKKRVDISEMFTRFKLSEDKKTNERFLNCWLADRVEEYKKHYFPRKKGALMLWVVDQDTNKGIACSYWYNKNGVVQ